MRNVSNTWAVVLAAGEGTRLREITTTEAGEIVPKQFCSLQRETCLLEDAISRAQAVAMPQHICSVVADQHRRWWSKALKSLPSQNILVQPKNCGTAHGVLLAPILPPTTRGWSIYWVPNLTIQTQNLDTSFQARGAARRRPC
jgi:mannose-1-phosphate guanylyltransferase